MTKHVVIVESPAKSRTIKKYLGKDYEVLASYGHVRDLVPKEGAVDPSHNFAMKYEPIERNQRHMDTIAKAVKKAEAILLAPDPDREGEAIAWHVVELLKERKLLKDKPVHRVVFHQITKRAIQEAVEHPREISMDLVNAQQARRALDYLVGFTLSPLLWRKIRAGLSAGRVQSPALRMIVERELDIEKFKSEEYWTIHADLEEKSQAFKAKLITYQDKKVEQFSITNEKQAQEVKTELQKKAKGKLTVLSIVKKERKRYPAPPFITSTLQQEAARKLGFSAAKTMQIAQQLYEGVDIGEGAQGLITYMRTDSVTLASEALTELRLCIEKRYGKENVPEQPNFYKTKSKNAQEAHEAIRPTSAFLIPDEMKRSLTADQYKLYNLIWKRALACQMIPATLDTVAIDLACGTGNVFRANGSTIVHLGFIAVYQEGLDDSVQDDEEGKILPSLKEGQEVSLADILTQQHFTEPPPRFTEASLVKALEEHDIGRPSTYASIISTLKAREYVEMDNKRFKPTDVGRVVTRFLTQYFTQYVDYNFTANLEDTLDEIAKGEKVWVPVLRGFWSPFKKLIDKINETVQRSDVTQEKIEEKCPECGEPLSIRLGRNGRFVGCTAYPKCSYTRNLQEENEPEVTIDHPCPQCQEPLVLRHGRYGKFIGCSNYPKCKHIEPFEKPKNTQVSCPSCKKGTIVERKSRRGKIFYSCDRYPDCQYALWNEPLAEACPKCHWPILTVKITKRRGGEKVCPQAGCHFTDAYTARPSRGEDEL